MHHLVKMPLYIPLMRYWHVYSYFCSLSKLIWTKKLIGLMYIFLWQTEVTTVICDEKQMKKLVDLGEKLESVKRIVYMEELGETVKQSVTGAPGSWTIASFQEVEDLGRKISLEPELPSANDVAVIMYTSGSTGMPKVRMPSLLVLT